MFILLILAVNRYIGLGIHFSYNFSFKGQWVHTVKFHHRDRDSH